MAAAPMATRTAQSGSPAPAAPLRLRFDEFELDEANATLLRRGQAIPVAPTPFAVLCALARQPSMLLTKQVLLDQVWGHQFVSESVLKTTISELRTLLGDAARQPRFIETVSRRGYRFIAATSQVHAVPVAQAAVRSPQDSAFIGRTDALSHLHGAWEAACAGKRAIVWVTGEPGIGKTTLMERFAASLPEAACARGQCVEDFGSGEPYLPVFEALAELCRADEALPKLLRAVAPTWLLQLPWLSTTAEREALQRELAGVGPERMLREMGELVDRYTESRPLLLVTEDLHWSDRATIRLIDHIARRRGGARFMWLASFRLAEVVALDHPLNALRRELRLHGLCDEITLDPFSETEIAQYVGQRSATLAADEPFVRALHEHTDGVPLFVASFIRNVMARGANASEDAVRAELADIPVPDNLAAIVDHYIARLDAERRRVLSAAAVCGVEFRVSTLARVLQQDAALLGQLCEDLAREQLWLARAHGDRAAMAAEAPYSFRHALFREVLYERTAPAARAQLHRSVGAALAGERAAGAGIAPAELALHFERGGDPLAALGYYGEAAEAALASFSPEECMRLTERALPLLGQAAAGPERSSLEISIRTLHGLAAFRALGVGSEARDALQRAYDLLEDAPDHPMRARLLHGRGFLLSLRAEYAEALAVAERAEALGAETNDPALLSTACTVHGEVDQLQGRWQAARTWLERGVPLAERLEVGSGEFLVDPQVALLASQGVPLLHLGLVEQARECQERALVRARARGWPMAQLVALWNSALVEVRLGAAERVAALADEMRALVDRYSLAHGLTACRWFRAWADARMGQAGDAHRRIREAYEENARLGMLTGASETLGYAAEALLLAGELDGAEKQLEEAFRMAEKLGERVYLVQLHLLQAQIARARGESALANAAVQRAIAEAQAQEAPWLEARARAALP